MRVAIYYSNQDLWLREIRITPKHAKAGNKSWGQSWNPKWLAIWEDTGKTLVPKPLDVEALIRRSRKESVLL